MDPSEALPESPAKVRLVAERPYLVPGESTTFALAFSIDPEWHLYWKGRNDSGFPPDVTASLPDGFRASPLQWPAPERHVAPGNILDHVYYGAVSLPFRVEVPASARIGETVALGFKVDWLVCREACIPGGDSLSISLPVRARDAAQSDGEPASDRNLVADALASIPASVPNDGSVQVEWKSGALVIQSRKAKSLAFYPAEECTEIEDPIATCVSDRGRLDLHFVSHDGSSPHAVGVVELLPPELARGGPASRRVYRLDTQPR